MKNQNRLSFYNKKFLYFFLNYKFALVCPKDYFLLVFNILKKENVLNKVIFFNIKKRFFYFFNYSFLKLNVSSNLFFLFLKDDVSISFVFSFLKNIPFYFLFYHYFFFDFKMSLNLYSFDSFLFFKFLYFFYFFFPFVVLKK